MIDRETGSRHDGDGWVRLAGLREAAWLAHTISTVSVRIRCVDDRVLLVAPGCLGADLSPCQLRAAVIALDRSARRDHPTRRFGDGLTIQQIDLVSGLRHVGGGIYEALGASAVAERWFVSTLGHHELLEVLSAFDGEYTDVADDAFAIVIKPDVELGVTGVQLTATDQRAARHLDELTLRARSATLAAELIAHTRHRYSPLNHSNPNPQSQEKPR